MTLQHVVGWFTTWQGFTLLSGAVCTLAIYSFLYKENQVYRFFEHLFMGVAGATGLVFLCSQTLYPKWYKPLLSAWHDISASGLQSHAWWEFAKGCLALLLGAMWYFVFSKRYGWVARIVMALQMGMAAGLAFPTWFGLIGPQIVKSFKPWVAHGLGGGVSLGNSVTNIVYMVTLFTVLVYFFFTISHQRPSVRGSARLGRLLLMVTFGAMFGNTIMARFSLFIERFQFLVYDWLGVPRPF